VVDVARQSRADADAIENYRAKNPKLVSRITFTKAPSPELPGKIKAQQGAKRVDIDLGAHGHRRSRRRQSSRGYGRRSCRPTRRSFRT